MRGGYALCFLGGGEKMHAVLLEKERVAVKMRHAVLKGDLVVLERFRKAGAAALGDALFERPVRQKARGGIGAALYVPKLCGRTDALCGTPPHASGIFGIDADIFVADSRVRYLKPVYEDLLVEVRLDTAGENAADAIDLPGALRGKGRASVRMEARTLLADGGVAAVLVGRYVAIARD